MSIKNLSKDMTYKVPQIRLALIKEESSETVTISTPDDISPYVEPLRHAADEYFVSFHLDARLAVIGVHEVSHGSLSASIVHPREVFKAAFLSNSYSLLVAHNHPSGSPLPSEDDLTTTETLVKAGQLLGIGLLDHLIVTRSHIYSIRENYPQLFGGK